MLHRFSFHQGEVSYANKFLQSPDYSMAQKTGKISYAEFATDPCRSIFKRVTSAFSPSEFGSNANVSISKMGESFVALTETPVTTSLPMVSTSTNNTLVTFSINWSKSMYAQRPRVPGTRTGVIRESQCLWRHQAQEMKTKASSSRSCSMDARTLRFCSYWTQPRTRSWPGPRCRSIYPLGFMDSTPGKGMRFTLGSYVPMRNAAEYKKRRGSRPRHSHHLELAHALAQSIRVNTRTTKIIRIKASWRREACPHA
jgi:hypothetical protein